MQFCRFCLTHRNKLKKKMVMGTTYSWSFIKKFSELQFFRIVRRQSKDELNIPVQYFKVLLLSKIVGEHKQLSWENALPFPPPAPKEDVDFGFDFIMRERKKSKMILFKMKDFVSSKSVQHFLGPLTTQGKVKHGSTRKEKNAQRCPLFITLPTNLG